MTCPRAFSPTPKKKNSGRNVMKKVCARPLSSNLRLLKTAALTPKDRRPVEVSIPQLRPHPYLPFRHEHLLRPQPSHEIPPQPCSPSWENTVIYLVGLTAGFPFCAKARIGGGGVLEDGGLRRFEVDLIRGGRTGGHGYLDQIPWRMFSTVERLLRSGTERERDFVTACCYVRMREQRESSATNGGKYADTTGRSRQECVPCLPGRISLLPFSHCYSPCTSLHLLL